MPNTTNDPGRIPQKKKRGRPRRAPQAPPTVNFSPPHTTVQEVEQSPYRHEVFSCLACGWSPARVARLLEMQYGATFPVEVLERYRAEIPPDHFLPEGHLTRRLKNLDAQVDAITEMGRLLLLAKQRLDTTLELEENTVEDSGRFALAPMIERQAETYWKMLGQYVKLRQSLGEMPSQALEVTAKVNVEHHLPTLAEIQRQRASMEQQLETMLPKSLAAPNEDRVVDADFLEVKEDHEPAAF